MTGKAELESRQLRGSVGAGWGQRKGRAETDPGRPEGLVLIPTIQGTDYVPMGSSRDMRVWVTLLWLQDKLVLTTATPTSTRKAWHNKTPRSRLPVSSGLPVYIPHLPPGECHCLAQTFESLYFLFQLLGSYFSWNYFYQHTHTHSLNSESVILSLPVLCFTVNVHLISSVGGRDFMEFIPQILNSHTIFPFLTISWETRLFRIGKPLLCEGTKRNTAKNSLSSFLFKISRGILHIYSLYVGTACTPQWTHRGQA